MKRSKSCSTLVSPAWVEAKAASADTDVKRRSHCALTSGAAPAGVQMRMSSEVSAALPLAFTLFKASYPSNCRHRSLLINTQRPSKGNTHFRICPARQISQWVPPPSEGRGSGGEVPPRQPAHDKAP